MLWGHGKEENHKGRDVKEGKKTMAVKHEREEEILSRGYREE